MELILWRHAEAENGYPDAARALTRHGLKQASQIAQWLKTRIPADSRILVSPARRTQQTVEALGLAYETTDRVGTGAGPEDVLSVSRWPDAEGTVLVVGHQPTLGTIASVLLCGEAADISFKKGAVWWFSHRGRHGGETVLRAVICPDLV